MRLAEDITVVIAGEDVELRPTLRRAIQLERREGGFKKLIADLGEGSLTAACDVIGYHDPHPLLINRVHDAGLMALRPALLAYVMALAGIDPDDVAKAVASGKPAKTIPFADHLAGLYRLGTGWLGWSPDTTLDATPAEITEAYRGRLDMLKAIFGASDTAKPKDTRPLEEKVRSIFGGIGTVKEGRVMNWSQLIKDLRAESGMSQRKLADAADVNRSTYCRIEAGQTRGNVEDIERILKSLGYELDVLPALRIPKHKDCHHGQAQPVRPDFH